MTEQGNSLQQALDTLCDACANIQFPDSQTIDGLELRLTCPAHPEQYDVYDGDTQVAYFRLRHGVFRVSVPDCGGDTIYTETPKGNGMFEQHERQEYLEAAVRAVIIHRAKSVTAEQVEAITGGGSDCTCPTLDGVPVTGSSCPVHGLERGDWD